jgi:putative zinc finger/helix-turn-helix YgiT family protein
MSVLCINCQKAEFRSATVRLSGVVRGNPYQVEMQGLKCLKCGFETVDAKGMTEFGRLLSDKYRAEHDLLTSEQILAFRNGFNESQDQFAKRCGIGVATLKRIEKGKIQDADTNRKILEATRPAIEQTAVQFQSCEAGSGVSIDGAYVEEWCAAEHSPLFTKSGGGGGYMVITANACSSCGYAWTIKSGNIASSTEFRYATRDTQDTTAIVPPELLLGYRYAR